VIYVAFDLLFLDGHDLSETKERKRAAVMVLPRAGT
jgi:ATP-dependent DNA ligase